MELIRTVTGHPPAFKTDPRPHQLEGLAFALLRRRCLLFYAMRLGKTKITLDWASHLKRSGLWQGSGLIIAHAPIGLDVWEREAAKHSDLTVKLVHLDVEDLLESMANPPDLTVMTWSGMQQMFCEKRLAVMGKKKGKPKLYVDYATIRIVAEAFSLVAIDEIHECSNWTSLHYKMALELVKHCEFRLGLTGTPFGRDPYSVWSQFKLIDDGESLSSSYPFFVEAFGKKKLNWFSKKRGADGKTYELVFDDKKSPILSAKMAQRSMAYARSEVEQDEVDHNYVELKMRGQQAEAYADAIDKVIKLDNLTEYSIEAVFHRLRQIGSGYLPYSDDEGEERVVHFANACKQLWLEEFLETMQPGMPCIFFHDYIMTGKQIESVLTKMKRKHVSIRGGTGDKRPLVAAFQDGKVDFIVANTKSGGISIDLNRADYMCYYESPVSPIVRAQSEARPLAERAGRLLTMEDLIASPMDQRVLAFLKQGRDLMAEVVTKADLKTLRV